MIRQASSIKTLHQAIGIVLRALFIATITLLLLTAQSASAQQTTSQSPSQSSSQQTSTARADMISGRIVTDDGQPLANARVAITRSGSAFTLDRPVVTIDAQGNFRSSNLVPGAYLVSGSLPGYLQASITPRGIDAGRYHPGDTVTITMIKGSTLTGQVTNERGEPIVSINVRATRIRTEDPLLGGLPSATTETDDRGIYRLFGLSPGVYLISVNDENQFSSALSPYARLAPTYYPSATRETAKEITLHRGEELSGLDIRFRNERGRTLSGTVTGAGEPFPGSTASWSVTLSRLPIGAGSPVSTYNQRDTGTRSFIFYGLPDGEYELRAEYDSGTSQYAASLPRRVTVKGTDVTGLEMLLLSLASVSGRIVAEKLLPNNRAASCAAEPIQSLQDTRITVRLDEKETPADRQRPNASPVTSGSPNAQGEFTIYKLAAGHYRFLMLPTNQSWYIRSITLPGPANTTRDVGREGLTLNLGERISGLMITVAEGSAHLQGQVIPDKEGTRLPPRLYVHAVPAEPSQADDVLRFAQALVRPDGRFTLEDLAPGRYWLIARPAPEGFSPLRTAAWETDERVKLRREAQAAKVELELQPCQRLNAYTLRYTPSDK